MPAASYGDRAEDITRIAEQRKLGRRLVRGYPVLEAEVVYAVHNEYCETPEDFIARRSRLAFLDTRACAEALPQVGALLLPCHTQKPAMPAQPLRPSTRRCGLVHSSCST